MYANLLDHTLKHSKSRQYIWLLVMLFVVATSSYAELPTTAFTLSVDTSEHNNVRLDEIHKVIDSDKFILLEFSNHSSARGSPWLKIEWDKSKLTNEKFLINDFTSQAYENYYLVKDDRVIKSYSSGFTDRFDARPIEHFKFVADVSDADYVLLKTCCNPGLPIYFRMLNAEELNKQYYLDLIWYAVVYALIAMMMLYNFFIFLYLREKQYLYYCYYLFSMLIVLLTLSGIGKQFIWSNYLATETFYFMSGLNASVASMLFLLAFLDNKYLTKLNKRLMYIVIGLHFCILGFYLFGSYIQEINRIANVFVQLISMSGWIITDYVIIRNILAGDRSARILLFSYLLINIAGALFVMRYNGYLTDSLWTKYIVDMAVLVEALILSLALAQKIQKLRDEKSQAEKRELTAQKEFSQQLMEVQEEEKKQLGSALHDNFTHQLLILKTNLASKLGVTAKETQHVDSILNDMRDLSHVIHPHLLEKLGLNEAVSEMIEKLFESYGLDVSFASDNIDLGKQQNLIIYRIIQESLNNIVKHANASECLIAIKQNDNMIEMLIKDDGTGFDVQNEQGLGLTTIKERSKMLKGELHIESDADGSRLLISFPYQKTSENNQPTML